MIDEVDELRRGAEAHFRQIGEAAVEFAREPGCGPAFRRGPGPCRRRDRPVRRERASESGRDRPHGHSRIARFFLGSTSDRVSEHCHCSVLIVK